MTWRLKQNPGQIYKPSWIQMIFWVRKHAWFTHCKQTIIYYHVHCNRMHFVNPPHTFLKVLDRLKFRTSSTCLHTHTQAHIQTCTHIISKKYVTDTHLPNSLILPIAWQRAPEDSLERAWPCRSRKAAMFLCVVIIRGQMWQQSCRNVLCKV